MLFYPSIWTVGFCLTLNMLMRLYGSEIISSKDTGLPPIFSHYMTSHKLVILHPESNFWLYNSMYFFFWFWAGMSLMGVKIDPTFIGGHPFGDLLNILLRNSLTIHDVLMNMSKSLYWKRDSKYFCYNFDIAFIVLLLLGSTMISRYFSMTSAISIPNCEFDGTKARECKRSSSDIAPSLFVS